MSNIESQTLEAYLLAENKQDFLNKLIPGTQSHTFFSLLHALNSSDQLSPEIEAQVERNYQQSPTPQAQSLHIRALLKKYDDPATKEEQKAEIIDKLLNKYLRFVFEYAKPSDLTTSALNLGQDNYPSVLDEKSISLDSAIMKTENDPNKIFQIQQSAYSRLDTKKIVKRDFNILERFLSEANPVDFDDFPEMIQELYQKPGYSQGRISSFFNRLTLEQLKALGKLNPALTRDSKYIRSLCSKEFHVTSLDELGQDLSRQEKRDLLFRFYSWAQKQSLSSRDLLSSALYEILQLDLELGHFDKQLFIEYLISPKRAYAYMTEVWQEIFSTMDLEKTSVMFGTERIAAEELIRTYLETFYKDAEGIAPFDEYLDSSRLWEIFYSTKLMMGKTPEQATSILGPDRLKTIAESKELTIFKQNKEYFKGNEPVTISLTIKNVPSLMVKIFEFKPENYYLKEKKQLDGSINLDGLIAAEEFSVDFKEPPVQRFTKEFKFESITKKKQGIFIIDFIGNGLSSRAIIQKGKLSYIERQTVAGQLFSIIDEETNICKGKETGIWIKDQLYRADEKGQILVPFSSNSSETVVLIHDGFAELTVIPLKAENFEFKCTFLYNYESLLMGNKAKVLVQPRLFLNQQPVGLDVIQECTATVVLTNTDNIPSRITFDKLKLSAFEETELEFAIPAKLKTVGIEVNAKIRPVNKKEPKEYISSTSISVDNGDSSPVISNLFLRYSNNGYEIVVLGKNGEPKKGASLVICYWNKYVKEKGTQVLQTDSNGKVYLGKLEDITTIEATLDPKGNSKEIRKYWPLSKQNSVNYPTKIRVCEGDQIVLPLLHNELSRHKISFTEDLENGQTIRNCLHLLKIDKKRLIVSGLSQGCYKLYLKDVDKKVSIVVLKGTYWSQNSHYLHAKDTLIDIKTDINNILVTDLQVKPQEGSELADLTIRAFVDQPKLARFHVFGAQFIDSDMNKFIKELNSNVPSTDSREIDLGIRKSEFLNNRILGDEYCYVLDRKSKPRYMGNTLEKPQILIKKTFVRETETTEEKLKDNADFVSPKAEADRMRRMMREMVGSAAGSVDTGKTRPDNFLNFLAHPCLIYSNLKANEEGVVVVKNFPYKRFSFVQIVTTNLTSNICETFPLECPQIQTKDLTQKARNENSVSSMKRISSNVLKGEKIEIKDIASTEFQVIDSLGRLFDYQKNLALCSSTPANSESYNQWSFLREWGDMKFEEKLKKYDKFASHELNLFVYFKDQEFYRKVVLPFLQNKIERTLVDYFLLNDEKALREYAKVEKFRNLNSLEQVLVIIAIRKSDLDHARKLAHLLEQLNALNKLDVDKFNKYFDTVMAAKKPEQDFDLEKKEKDKGDKKTESLPVSNTSYRSYGAMNCYQPDMYSTRMRVSGSPKLKLGVQKAMKYFDDDDDDDEEELGDDYEELREFEDNEFIQKRNKVQAGFQELEKTKEYTERHYYGQKAKNVSIPLNAFWVDCANHIVDHDFSKPFLTQNFIYAHSSHTEMIGVFSLLSLPFRAEEHLYKPSEDLRLEIQAGSNLIVFTKAVTEAECVLKDGILITQRFFDPQDRFTESEEEPGVQVEKDVDQYIINKAYGGSVIVTNSTTSSQHVQVLVEIPEGAIPVGDSDYTKSYNMQLNAFSTQTLNFQFYFPKTGTFKVNPASVSKRSQVIAVGKTQEIQVQAEKVYASLETLQAVLSKGSKEDVLNFARTKNIWNKSVFNFNAIYWLLKDKTFFLEFIKILRDRKCYDPSVWQFGFYHKDSETVKEYFTTTPENPVTKNILHIDSSILQVDKLQLLEYYPYINQRAHLLASDKNRILNVQLRDQYKNYLSYLCERKTLDTSHYLGLVYYLLLQDRVQDAMRLFGKIDREEVRKTHQHELQYDYFAAYIDFYVGYPKFTVAREICQKYLDYPVLSWRSLFVEVANQLAEYDGKETISDEGVTNEEKRQNLENAEKEQVVTMELQNAKIEITHRNVKEIRLSFYRIDLEVLFSRNPFINQSKDEFSFIQPSHIEKIKIDNAHDLGKQVYEIPKNLQKNNLHVELRSDNKTLTANYFSTSLKTYLIENYGQVKVVDEEDQPLSKVYVKCFAKGKDGKVSFYKDGYTDLRGRFDYATLNSNDISNIEKFAIFIMSDDLGSLIKEAKAPNKLGRIVDK